MIWSGFGVYQGRESTRIVLAVLRLRIQRGVYLRVRRFFFSGSGCRWRRSVLVRFFDISLRILDGISRVRFRIQSWKCICGFFRSLEQFVKVVFFRLSSGRSRFFSVRQTVGEYRGRWFGYSGRRRVQFYVFSSR